MYPSRSMMILCVQLFRKHLQQYPVCGKKPKVTQEIDLPPLKRYPQCRKSAEPGVLFWDTILRESVADCYANKGLRDCQHKSLQWTLHPYDSCRLIAINLYSYVDNPFTSKLPSTFLFSKNIAPKHCLMDDY